jgi:formylglycine-generating enzyme required for sulfatase activity
VSHVTNAYSFTRAALASALLVTACTHDFTGYHLEDANAGGSAGSDVSGLAGDTVVSVGSSPSASGGKSSSGSGGHGGGITAISGSGGVLGVADSGAAGDDSGGHGGSTNAGPPASCVDLPVTCGSAHTASCCSASSVPGGTYERSDQPGATATVSAFALDDYEVTVGRFRKFIAAYTQTMTLAGSGKNPNDALDPGWDSAWNGKLPASSAALATAVQCSGGTFTAATGANELEPVTCVNWYEAFAFCAWDGARLPTEAEWNYAAAGGTDELSYPVFCPGSCGKVQAVGSKAPAGNGKWGQADLVGNAWEWNVDVFANPYVAGACDDCANTNGAGATQRVFRGGSAGNDATFLLSANRYGRDPSDHNAFIGLRCARTP